MKMIPHSRRGVPLRENEGVGLAAASGRACLECLAASEKTRLPILDRGGKVQV